MMVVVIRRYRRIAAIAKRQRAVLRYNVMKGQLDGRGLLITDGDAAA